MNIPCHAKEGDDKSFVLASSVVREGKHSFKASEKFFMQILTSVKFFTEFFSCEKEDSWESASTCSLMRWTRARLHTFSISAPVTQKFKLSTRIFVNSFTHTSSEHFNFCDFPTKMFCTSERLGSSSFIWCCSLPGRSSASSSTVMSVHATSISIPPKYENTHRKEMSSYYKDSW